MHLRPSFIVRAFLALIILSTSARAFAAEYAQPDVNRLALGDGFHSLEGERRLSCLAQKTLRPAGTPSQKVEYELVHVTSAEQMRSLLGISASARFGTGLWKAQGSAKYLSTRSYQSTVVRLVARVEVLNQDETIDSAVLKPALKSLSAADFRSQCGDSFVASVATGGSFLAVFEYTASSSSEAEQFAASLKFSTWAGAGAAANFQKEVEKLKSYASLNITVLRKGPIEDVPTTIDKILDAAKTFPTKVATSGGAPYQYKFVTMDYRTLGRPLTDPDTVQRESVVFSLAEAADLARERATRLQDVLSSPDKYSFTRRAVELKALTGNTKVIADYVDATTAAFKKCLDVKNPCASSVVQPVPVISTPQLLSLAGGCDKWDAAGDYCLKYSFTASQLGSQEIKEGGAGARTYFAALPPGKKVEVRYSGLVRPNFRNHFGNSAGDSNGGVDWWLIANLVVDAPSGARSTQWTRANIRSNAVQLTVSDIVETRGSLAARLLADHVQMWPNDHGPLGLDGAFTMTAEIQP